jgi:hypothetical protein
LSAAVDLPQTEAVARVGSFQFIKPETSPCLTECQSGYCLVQGHESPPVQGVDNGQAKHASIESFCML